MAMYLGSVRRFALGVLETGGVSRTPISADRIEAVDRTWKRLRDQICVDAGFDPEKDPDLDGLPNTLELSSEAETIFGEYKSLLA